MSLDLDQLSDDALDRALDLARRLAKDKKSNNLDYYAPYAWQKKFHLLGSAYTQRMLMAPTQSGKTMSAAAEVAMHLTGRYPDWWEGKRYPLPVTAWAMGVDYKQLRRAGQRLLLGEHEIGTGMIPADCIVGHAMMQGAPGNYDFVRVKHTSGMIATLYFKTYEQGRASLQGDTIDIVWMDEEPEKEDLFDEIVGRTIVRGGILFITYTPLLGETNMTNLFYNEQTREKHRTIVQVGADEVPHMTRIALEAGHPTASAYLKTQYSPHQWRARIDGMPALGKGAVFPFLETQFVISPLQLPAHTRWIAGMDYGISHPTTFIIMAWVPDDDMTYFVNEYCEANKSVAQNASWINRNYPNIRIAWPHDMNNREGAGKSGAIQYTDESCNMLPMHAQYDDERKNGQEDSVWEFYQGIENGSLKVFNTCQKLLTEMRSYHRDDKNKIVPKKDDVISAARYALMMRRFSQPLSRIGRRSMPKGGPEQNPLAKPWWMDNTPPQTQAKPRRGTEHVWSSGKKP